MKKFFSQKCKKVSLIYSERGENYIIHIPLLSKKKPNISQSKQIVLSPLSGGPNMKYRLLTDSEMENEVSGEALTLTAVMAVLATAIIAVIVYKLFLSDKGSATVPGGWKFSWN